jgi:hypothetical protein
LVLTTVVWTVWTTAALTGVTRVDHWGDCWVALRVSLRAGPKGGMRVMRKDSQMAASWDGSKAAWMVASSADLKVYWTAALTGVRKAVYSGDSSAALTVVLMAAQRVYSRVALKASRKVVYLGDSMADRRAASRAVPMALKMDS